MARPPKGKPLTYRPIRLDDDVWKECQRLGKEHGTINEGLRKRLLDPSPAVHNPPPALQRSSKPNKRERVAQELAANDITAQIVGRVDIEYGHHETLPRGEHVANWRRGPREKGDKTT